ncbi:hypothetical protein BsWGS_11830 [Bradybaena similaris]
MVLQSCSPLSVQTALCAAGSWTIVPGHRMASVLFSVWPVFTVPHKKKTTITALYHCWCLQGGFVGWRIKAALPEQSLHSVQARILFLPSIEKIPSLPGVERWPQHSECYELNVLTPRPPAPPL